jgi:hypothetical protein
MLGAPKKDHEHSGRLAYILENIHNLPSLKLMREPDIEQLFTGSSQSPTISHDSPPLFFSEPIYTEPLSYEPPVTWRNVTEDLDIRIKHGEDWVLLGRVFHSLFEELSKGILKLERLKERASDLLRNTVLNQGDLGRLLDIIKGDFRKLDLSGHLGEIILPHDHAFTELPFVLRKGDTVFKGRIDRVIIRDKAAFLYDYKTFPAQERELTELIGTYRFQMDIYKTAAEKLFSLNSRGFLLFTHLPLLVEV